MQIGAILRRKLSRVNFRFCDVIGADFLAVAAKNCLPL